MSYAMRQTLHMPFQAALDHTIACLKHEGFGVLTNLDLQASSLLRFIPHQDLTRTICTDRGLRQS
eukprot:m.82219 g.82219  ORF g.82219 m.82219 type:complete len:65 (+) comp50772_c0_seq3:742-936(+)